LQKGFELGAFLDIMTTLTAPRDDDTTVNFIFDLYTGFGKTMSHETLVEVFQTFNCDSSS